MKLKYQDFLQRTSFSKQELLAYSWGDLIEDPPIEGCGLLPSPPMLMFDRITEISHKGKRGRIVAEQDIALDDWFFQCHFRQDPVQPGCLGVDAVWQLIGFYAIIRGGKGAGRALGAGGIEFFGQIRPHNKIVRYEIDIKRFSNMAAQDAAIAIGSAKVFVDDQEIYTINDAKAGIFKNIQYRDYPHESEQSLGGQLT
ncbi:bifunctional 3-hydroxydecanoyl-ACP dehydratase/trans-2-decenoyl-ACP isomerase [Marinicella gelatinilytica]|uniref:bifunctional 3-hydroxydecanoyl-ACP dehydratase/trans-2-decenoyl-ACP isomerase n=1 Tax=Marinicella gelatinilytica TaxID=2996017 RepID=UPI002260DA7F|nr:bifunctional 3-hydroxydecanoyl-ACP dehydratase/trans-2-decenoyl-ACP isomerase [Marinicella gelatinilytica]MCX7544022.1 bifunctional 3-hydroxydecanoyl-ACP dehydratase/trans-2-decenoyl-ACP isomerase [Marinicella gelatinilytica]